MALFPTLFFGSGLRTIPSSVLSRYSLMALIANRGVQRDDPHGPVAGGANSLRLNGRIDSPGGCMPRTRASSVGGP